MPQHHLLETASSDFPTDWVVGALTISFGAFAAFAGFAAPLLFGPLAASVIAADRLLRATRGSDARLSAAWLTLSLGWIALAMVMLHPPWASSVPMQAAVTLLVVGNAACWAWARRHHHLDILPIVVGSALALGFLYESEGGPSARIAAAASIAVALVGMQWMLAGSAHGAPRPPTVAGDPAVRSFSRTGEVQSGIPLVEAL